MPTYEYTCRDCGHTFDIVQSMWDEPLTMCPECGGSLRKVFSPPAISFKGSGFYATDHGKRAETPAEQPKESREGGEKKKKKKDAKDAAPSTSPSETSPKKEPAAS
jgi:putative FmdB family regulatory protein